MSDERRIPPWVLWTAIAILMVLAAAVAFYGYGLYREWQSFGPHPARPNLPTR